jgi:hypothetical protein
MRSFSPFMTKHRICHKSNTTGQDRNSYPRSPPIFSGVSVCSFFRFLCSVLCIIAGHFVLLFFLTLHCTSLHVIRWHLQPTTLVSWNCDQHWKYIWRMLTCVTGNSSLDMLVVEIWKLNRLESLFLVPQIISKRLYEC